MNSLLERYLEQEPGPLSLREDAGDAGDARDLARLAVFGTLQERELARYVVRSLAARGGAFPASIAAFYAARGRGAVQTMTVPAFNVRGMTFDFASAAFRAMKARDAAAAIFELNRAEVAFTAQEPDEFASVVLAAAFAEGWSGPVFLQLDHLMANAREFARDAETEAVGMEDLVARAVAAGLFNVDIDASTLVDLSRDAVADQQQPNIDVTARLGRLVRAIEPPGIRVSLGGEIGEVGGHNSTEEELRAFVDGFNDIAADIAGGLAKVSVQTGTRHGGIRLPDGSVAAVALDFGTLGQLSAVCRDSYGMAGAVQHGASTLPEELFPRFPQSGCAEVHLATGFQDLVLDHPAFPAELRDEMERWTLSEAAGERSQGDTDRQFVRRGRRKAWGPYKRATWDIGGESRAEIMASLEARIGRTLELLAVVGSAGVVVAHVGHSPPPIPQPSVT